MRPALMVFGYALVVAWFLPALLSRLTARGIRARLGLLAWLTAMVSVLACAATALQFLIRAAIAGWPGLAEAVCRSVAGAACAPTIYRSAIFELGLAATAIVAALAVVMLAWRYGRGLQQAQRRTRVHGEAARITGRRLRDAGAPTHAGAGAPGHAGDGAPGHAAAGAPGHAGDGLPGHAGAGAFTHAGAVVLDAPQPVAYCVPGRPATIVLTSGALAVLEPEQLTAVLAHERAHLAGRHHLLIGLTRGLAACFPAVPLFTRGPAEVARLAEMCADDAAARRSGRPALVTALLAMATGTAVPGTAVPGTAVPATAVPGTAVPDTAVPTAALGATGCAVPARVERLLEPPRRARQARYGLALITVTLLLSLSSGLVTVFAGVVFAGTVAAHGIPVG